MMKSKFRENECVELGRCTSAHGLAGLASADLFNFDDDSILNEMPLVWLVPFKENEIKRELAQKAQINHIESTPKKVIIGFTQFEDRTALELILPCGIWIERSKLPTAKKGEYYLFDLRGMEVRDKLGNKIGRVKGTYQVGEVQNVIIEKLLNGEIELPMVQNFVKNIDLDKKIMTIEMPEYIEADDE